MYTILQHDPSNHAGKKIMVKKKQEKTDCSLQSLWCALPINTDAHLTTCVRNHAPPKLFATYLPWGTMNTANGPFFPFLLWRSTTDRVYLGSVGILDDQRSIWRGSSPTWRLKETEMKHKKKKGGKERCAMWRWRDGEVRERTGEEEERWGCEWGHEEVEKWGGGEVGMWVRRWRSGEVRERRDGDVSEEVKRWGCE